MCRPFKSASSRRATFGSTSASCGLGRPRVGKIQRKATSVGAGDRASNAFVTFQEL